MLKHFSSFENSNKICYNKKGERKEGAVGDFKRKKELFIVFENFVEYCRMYNSASQGTFCNDPDHLLRFWRDAKDEYLKTLLGNELIISKKITYELNYEELVEQFEQLAEQNHEFYFAFYDILRDALGATMEHYLWTFPSPSDQEFFDTVRSWGSADSLISNHVDHPIRATINGTLLKINAGEKIMRALRKICAALATNYVDLTPRFEQLRQQHAQILGQKNITGTLCLSIHPLDYATASDNANGWSSCMSWQEEGCYRLGTVEMMNSPMVICAYLSSNVQEMEFSSYTWPSKKWRAWIIITKDAILCNRNYPFDSDDLSKECIKWVATLAEQNLGWDFSHNITTCADLEDAGIRLDYRTDFMYNDFRSEMWATVRSDLPKGHYRINYSGIANCMNCGEEISFYGSQDSSTLCCDSCNDVCYCSECGCAIREGSEEYYIGPNDEILCPDCYSQIITHCEICDTDIYVDEALHVRIPLNQSLYAELTGRNSYMVPSCEQYLCPDCAEQLGITSDMILEDVSFPPEWNVRRWEYSDILDPRRITKNVFYRLLGLQLNENNQIKYKWMEHFIRDHHIDELWDDCCRFFEKEGN